MIIALIFLALAGLLLALFWLLFSNRPHIDSVQAALEIHNLLPKHCRHFPQIQHMLNLRDESFVERHAPLRVAKQWRAERRAIIQLYIQGLREDFHRLEKLARLLAALSPEVKRAQEWEWFVLGAQFRVLYGATQLRFAIRSLPTTELVRLTEMLTALRLMLENAMNDMTEALPKSQETLAT